MTKVTTRPASDEWVSFPGGELEGKRPKRLCGRCQARPGTLCFQCYRGEIERERRLKAARAVDTGSAERFQELLPFEPVNRVRLAALKAERAAARAGSQGIDRFADRRRHAQIAARRALQRAIAGAEDRTLAPSERARVVASAIDAAELQLPDAWLPFVVSR